MGAQSLYYSEGPIAPSENEQGYQSSTQPGLLSWPQCGIACVQP